LGGYIAQHVASEVNIRGETFNAPGLHHNSHRGPHRPDFIHHSIRGDDVGSYQASRKWGRQISHNNFHKKLIADKHTMEDFVAYHFRYGDGGKCKDAMKCRRNQSGTDIIRDLAVKPVDNATNLVVFVAEGVHDVCSGTTLKRLKKGYKKVVRKLRIR